MDPGTSEAGTGSGFGLVQWTPGTKHSDWWKTHKGNYDDSFVLKTDRDDEKNGYKSMDAQLLHLIYEAEHAGEPGTLGWSSDPNWGDIYYKGTIDSFKTFAYCQTQSPYYLACAFAWCYEKPGVVQWGFHTNGAYGGKKANGEPDDDVPPEKHVKGQFCTHEDYYTNGKAYSPAHKGCWSCYKLQNGLAATNKQAEANRNELRETRGGDAFGGASYWYNYFIEETFPKLPEDTSYIFTQSYWITQGIGSGCNIFPYIMGYTSDDDGDGIPNAIEAATEADLQRVGQTPGTVLPNCTSWAWGRAYQIMGKAPSSYFKRNAGDWFSTLDKEVNPESATVLSNNGYSVGQTPQLGAIMCWRDPNRNDGWGHVAIVEEIHKDAEGNITGVTFSESGYNSWHFRDNGYINIQREKDITGPNRPYSKYEFQGYIYLPGRKNFFLPPIISNFRIQKLYTETTDFAATVTSESPATLSYCLNGTKTYNITPPDDLCNMYFTADNLVPNTEYFITLMAENAGGKTISDKLPFTTLQDYPSPVKNISIGVKSNNKLSELSDFLVSIEEPEYWGYWKRIGNDYGYRIFVVSNTQIVEWQDDTTIPTSLIVKPSNHGIDHGANFQMGVTTWVKDNNNEYVFNKPVPGDLYPKCSNSICLKELNEMSDIWYLMQKDKITRLQPYLKSAELADFTPLNIFINK